MFLKMVTLFTCQPYRSHVFWCPLIWPSHCRIFVTCKCVVQLKFGFGTQLLGFFFSFFLSFFFTGDVDDEKHIGYHGRLWNGPLNMRKKILWSAMSLAFIWKIIYKRKKYGFFFSLKRIIYKPIMVIVDWVKFDLCIVSYQNGAHGFQEQIMGCIEQNTCADSCHVVLLI